MGGHDWKRLDQVFEHALEWAMRTSGFGIEQISGLADVLLYSGDARARPTKTHGRKAMGNLNQAVFYTWDCPANRQSQFQF